MSLHHRLTQSQLLAHLHAEMEKNSEQPENVKLPKKTDRRATVNLHLLRQIQVRLVAQT